MTLNSEMGAKVWLQAGIFHHEFHCGILITTTLTLLDRLSTGRNRQYLVGKWRASIRTMPDYRGNHFFHRHQLPVKLFVCDNEPPFAHFVSLVKNKEICQTLQ
jgi:hypothetical protein